MTESTHAELKRLAEEATPGPWERLEGVVEVGHPIYKPGTVVTRIVQKRAPNETAFNKVALVDTGPSNAAYIAAANPARVLHLIEENERLTKGLRHYECSCKPGHCAMSADETDTPIDDQMCGRVARQALGGHP